MVLLLPALPVPTVWSALLGAGRYFSGCCDTGRRLLMGGCGRCVAAWGAVVAAGGVL